MSCLKGFGWLQHMCLIGISIGIMLQYVCYLMALQYASVSVLPLVDHTYVTTWCGPLTGRIKSASISVLLVRVLYLFRNFVGTEMSISPASA